MKLRVLIADDHDVLCTGIRTLLEGIDGAEFVGEAFNGRDAVKLAHDLVPDVVLMDIVMPELNGIDAGRQILSQGAGIKLIAVSARSDRQVVLEAIHAGFLGFISKSFVCREMASALQTIAEGKPYLSPQINDLVITEYMRTSASNRPSSPCPLSAREREVLHLVAEGSSSKEIAKSLHLGRKTVEAHRAKIMDKLDIHSIAGLTKYAVRNGLSSLE